MDVHGIRDLFTPLSSKRLCEGGICKQKNIGLTEI